jgi:hypothetical protein
MGDDGLRLDPARRQPDLDPALGPAHGSTHRAGGVPVRLRAGCPPRSSASVSSGCHRLHRSEERATDPAGVTAPSLDTQEAPQAHARADRADAEADAQQDERVEREGESLHVGRTEAPV